MKNTATALVLTTVFLVGCATTSTDIAATYVSPEKYESLNCSQLAEETQRIQEDIVETGGRLDLAAAQDKSIMGVGRVLFWPVLFILGGTKNQEIEFSQLKGRYQAVQKASITGSCSTILEVAKPNPSNNAAIAANEPSATTPPSALPAAANAPAATASSPR